MITFEEAIKDDIQGFCVYLEDGTEIPGFFTNGRVARNSLPTGWFAYDIRGGDNEDFCTIEPFVRANHTGTFLCKSKIPLVFTEYDKDGYFELDDENWSFDDGVFENPDFDISEWTAEKDL